MTSTVGGSIDLLGKVVVPKGVPCPLGESPEPRIELSDVFEWPELHINFREAGWLGQRDHCQNEMIFAIDANVPSSAVFQLIGLGYPTFPHIHGSSQARRLRRQTSRL